MSVLAQVVLDTPPVAATVGPTPVDVVGASLSFIYPGEPIVYEAEMNWLKSSLGSNIHLLYVTTAAGVRQYGQGVQVAQANKNFTSSLISPAFTEQRDSAGLWTPMVPGTVYSVKLQWAFNASATLTCGWSPGSEFYSHFRVRTA